MPRYFMHLHNDVEAVDEEGVDYPDLASVRRAAEKAARELAAEEVKEGRLNLANWIEVTDAQGRALFKIRYADVVSVLA